MEQCLKKIHLRTIFITLYTYQGILYGLMTSIRILLQKENVSYQKLSVYDWVFMPTFLKFLFSPLLDIYYMRRIGKRMSYIIPLSILSCVLFIVLGFYANSLI